MLAIRRSAPLLLALGLPAGLFAFGACDGASSADADGGAGASTGGGASTPKPRRVVGYLPTYRSLDPARLDFETLTHLCVAFANPVEGGGSDFDEGARSAIPPLVAAAHEHEVKVLASIAGGTDTGGGAVLAQITEDVDAYVASLLELIEKYDLDGIDVDIEGKHVNETYEPFVLKLKAALPAGKLLTAAVATKNGDDFSSKALGEYDFINLMAYDHCGWSETPCEHSSMKRTLEELEYWTGDRPVPRDKLVLGVPFYGWCWGCGDKQTAMTYSDILSQYPEAKTTDRIEDGDKTISLNGATTIAEKAELAQEYGGVMIWELGQDASGDDALFRVIAEAQPARPE